MIDLLTSAIEWVVSLVVMFFLFAANPWVITLVTVPLGIAATLIDIWNDPYMWPNRRK